MLENLKVKQKLQFFKISIQIQQFDAKFSFCLRNNMLYVNSGLNATRVYISYRSRKPRNRNGAGECAGQLALSSSNGRGSTDT